MSLIRQIKEHKCRSYKSLITFAGYFTFGLFSGIFGPTILDLSVKVSTDLGKVAFILPSKSAGSIFGTLIIGLIYTRSTWQLSSSVTLTILAASGALVPFMDTFMNLMSVTLVHGFMGGIFTCGSFIFINDLWGRESQPFQQILQFTFGAGSFTSPLIAQPYLLKRSNETNSSIIYKSTDVKLQSPFLIIASTAILPAILSMITWYFHPYSPSHPSRWNDEEKLIHNNDDDDDDEDKTKTKQLNEKSTCASTYGDFDHVNDNDVNDICNGGELATSINGHIGTSMNGHAVASSVGNINVRVGGSINNGESIPLFSTINDRELYFKRWQNIVIVLSLFFMHLYYGIEVAYGTYISTFVQKCSLHLSESVGAFMSSAFWFTFTSFKLLAALYIEWLGSELNITISLLIMLIANFVLLPFGEESELALWIGTIIVGIGTATVWASYFAYLEQFFTLSKRVTVSLMVASLLGDFVLPIIIANYIQTYPRVFLYVYLIASVNMVFLFAGVVYICRFILTPNQQLKLPFSSVTKS